MDDGAKVGSRAERVSHHSHHPACGHTFESRLVLIFPLGYTAGMGSFDIGCCLTPEDADVLDRVRPATIAHSPHLPRRLTPTIPMPKPYCNGAVLRLSRSCCILYQSSLQIPTKK